MNLKLILAIIYILCLCIVLFIVFNYLDFKELTNYSYIKDSTKLLSDYKNNHIIFFTLIFAIFSICWILLLGFGTPIAIISGFLFGKWIGTFIVILTFTIGSSLLYILAQFYFRDFIIRHFSKKIEKYKNLFHKNELLYFLIFRLSGGAGIPFAIQNILPTIFDMKIKNYIISTFFGLIPTIFIISSLGSGIKSVIGENNSISYKNIISDPEIYWPLIGFLIILITSFLCKKIFFKKN
tara:strand:- start:52 stop:765 length:714 start_codon:yes stop_codon:yes gene_type:complete